jgi:uncharacterized surface protein with fasciclin (FAS1) repeats
VGANAAITLYTHADGARLTTLPQDSPTDGAAVLVHVLEQALSLNRNTGGPYMNRLTKLALICMALVVPAGPAIAAINASAESTESQTIVGVAASDPEFSTLVSLVKKAGLVEALSGTQKLTVFAPTNAAFAAVPKHLLKKLAKNKALLVKVLEYHVVAGEVLAAEAVKLHSAKTLEGAKVHIHVRGGHVFINKAKVIKANVHASNGVIHVINKVLLPPGV